MTEIWGFRAIELYCTYFDHNYLRKGIALYLSLRKHTKNKQAVLLVLALSERCESILRQLALPGLTIVSLKDLEDKEPRLLKAKTNRRLVEYFFTLTPWVIKLAIERFPEAERATYLDSDLYFHSSIEPLWSEIGSSPMAFVEHRFSANYMDRASFGQFNVGWNTFNRSKEAQTALNWWAEQCLMWCYDRIEGDKFADQGYLTTIGRKFKGVHILRYPGINLAEYNLDNYRLSKDSEGPKADGYPVIYWHMHALFEQKNGTYKVLMRKDLLENEVIKWAYQNYVDKLRQLSLKFKSMGLPVDSGNARYPQL